MRTTQAGFIERPVTFGYDFRMRCDACGNASELTGADYIRLNNEAGAHMDCEHCDNSIHFGPLAADIRDPDDLALDDALVNKLSWYHTSSYPAWPSPDYTHDVRAAFAGGRTRALLGNPALYLQRQLTKALHLGTYEAAIENMYRRMRNEADENSTFYLHRVRVKVDPDRLNRGYRHENDEPAAHISTTELADLGFDAIRYVNVWEASGCISLAILPNVITEIQTIQIPQAVAPNVDLDKQVAEHIQDLTVRDSRPGTPDERQFRGYGLTQELEEALIARFLPGVNPVVADDFARAITARQGHGRSDFLAIARAFAQHAVLLTEPELVMRLLDSASVRTLV